MASTQHSRPPPGVRWAAACVVVVILGSAIPVAQSAGCQSLPGYTCIPDVDHAGDDIKRINSVSVSKLVNACNADATCISFNSMGYIKRRADVSYQAPGVCLYVKNPCQSVAGYTGIPNVDYAPDNIKMINKGSVSDLVKACNTDATCMSFNSMGYIKRMAGVSYQAPGVCLYVKNPCQSVPGYTGIPNVDYAPDNIKMIATGSVSDLTAACNADATCMSFNSMGYIKRMAGASYPAAGVCLYVKNPCQSVAGYTGIPNVDYAADDIKRINTGSVSDFVAACNADGTCMSFNSLGYLKRLAGASYPAAGVCLYVKNPCQSVAGYTGIPNVDHAGDDIKWVNSGSVSDFITACNADATCMSVNSMGYTKRKADVSYFAAGVCLYVKNPCQSVPGYTGMPNADHVGDDISRVTTGSVTDLSLSNVYASSMACSTDASCMSFNSLGYTIGKVDVSYPATGVCLYVKNPCQSVAGYTGIPNVDHNGDDIKTVGAGSLFNLIAACNADATCMSFNSLGSIKRKADVSYQAAGVCLYVKNPCQSLAGYTGIPNADHNGDDIKTVSAGSLFDQHLACQMDATCMSFNSLGYIKRKADVSIQAAGVCLYVKNPCRSVPGYTGIPNVDHAGDDINTINNGSLYDISLACYLDTTCVSFNSMGYIKRRTGVSNQANGVCLYVKNRQ